MTVIFDPGIEIIWNFGHPSLHSCGLFLDEWASVYSLFDAFMVGGRLVRHQDVLWAKILKKRDSEVIYRGRHVLKVLLSLLLEQSIFLKKEYSLKYP